MNGSVFNVLAFKKNIAVLVTVMFFLCLLVSCVNDPEEVKKATVEDESPLEIQENVRLTYTDSGMVKLILEADRAENFGHTEEPTLVFPEGIFVRFFNEEGEEDSQITSEYAIRYVNKKLWKARGDVVVLNSKGEKLNTEELFWDEEKEIIYSNVFVKMTTEDQIIMGEGFESDQNFTNAEVKKVTGQILLDEE
ncbi:MAG: LPS export ABC transporter periplasmic protein LptC [Schleiferiaceae bacterium]|nr:LPS export ABC transporter periplasmic protein LptC [Schleiferiaceae bacterium]